MISRETFYNCLASQVGWKPTADACVSVDLTGYEDAESGKYFQDLSGVTLSLISQVLDKDSADLETWIEDTHRSAANRVITDYIRLHKRRLQASSLIKHQDVGVKPRTSIRAINPNNGDFVGLSVKVRNNKSLALLIEDIKFGAILTGAQAPFNLYVYSETNLDPITTVEINPVDGNITWQGKSIDLYYNDGSVGAVDEYFIGYYEADLIGNSIDTKKPCGNCGWVVKRYGERIHIRGMRIRADHTYGDRKLPDVEHAGYTDQTFGLSFRFSLSCDITPIVCDNVELFSTAFQLAGGIKFFWDVWNNANRGQNITADGVTSKDDAQMMAEKYEDDYKQELESIVLDLESVDCDCSGHGRGVLTTMGL